MTAPKKHLSQNFLTNSSVALKVANALPLTQKDTVLEVGPGKGILTELLLSRVSQVIAVEKDPELVKLLEEKFYNEIANKKLIIFEGDTLDEAVQEKVFKILRAQENGYQFVANIPYAITGKLLRFFLTHPHPPKNIAILVQKEVAERIMETPPRESLLSISVKAYGSPKYLHTVKSGNFFPKPKVDSAVLAIENISKDFFEEINEADFFAMLRAGFLHKRKYVQKNIEKAFPEKTFDFEHIKKTARAQELSLFDWKKIMK